MMASKTLRMTLGLPGKLLSKRCLQYSTLKPNKEGRYLTKLKVFDPFMDDNVHICTQHEGILTWYSCGPTVYDTSHIGHACTYIRQDIIRRIIRRYEPEIEIVQLMGITDIDDKIILKAKSLNVDWRSISRQYEKEFFDDMKSLNVLPPNLTSRVTLNITEIVEFIELLMSKGFAYVNSEDSGVYFDTENYSRSGGTYGKLIKLADQSETETAIGKKNVADFALWKPQKSFDEPSWDFPGNVAGRPGWHIECSAMAGKVFGSNVDIHSGGRDLIFPHHENEEAQSCGRFGSNKWVHHWLHMGHLHFKGDSAKMSKSLGNTISIREFLQSRQSGAAVLRMLCLLSSYRSFIEYSEESANHAEHILKKLDNFLLDCQTIVSSNKCPFTETNSQTLMEGFLRSRILVHACLQNDFDTPGALQAIISFIQTFYQCYEHDRVAPSSSTEKMAANYISLTIHSWLSELLNNLGFDEASVESQGQNENILLQELLEFRSHVRSYALASEFDDKQTRKLKILERKVLMEACDKVRQDLIALGFSIKDKTSKEMVGNIALNKRSGK